LKKYIFGATQITGGKRKFTKLGGAGEMFGRFPHDKIALKKLFFSKDQ